MRRQLGKSLILLAAVVFTASFDTSAMARRLPSPCERRYNLCMDNCDKMSGQARQACIGQCGTTFVNCAGPVSSPTSLYQPGQPPGQAPKGGIIHRPPASGGTKQPPSGGSGVKTNGRKPPTTVGNNPGVSGGGTTTIDRGTGGKH
jgi:hypothetical protein